MTLLTQPPYMTADARPPTLPRECATADGDPKAVYRDRRLAKRALRAIGVPGLHSYECHEGQRHIGHRR